jgi:hypothetical protein
VDTRTEREVAHDVEQELAELLVSSPRLAQLPIAPLRGIADLVRLELALRLFADNSRDERGGRLVREVEVILWRARSRLREAANL